MSKAEWKIPFARPQVSMQAIHAASACLMRGELSSGQEVQLFEQELAQFLDAPHQSLCVVNSGMTGLRLSLQAMKNLRWLCDGDEILLPSFTFAAPLNAVIKTGLKPKLVPINPSSGMIDPALLDSSIGPRTKAIIIVHLFGHAAPMDAIVTWAKKHGLWIIEDAAESFGARWNKKAAGTWGDVGIFSFQSTKALSIGEGGAIHTPHALLAQQLFLLRGHGMGQEKYWHEIVGDNGRLTSYQAAIGRALLQEFSCTQKKLQDHALYFYHELEKLNLRRREVGLTPWQAVLPEKAETITPWSFLLLTADLVERQCLEKTLATQAIEYRPVFKPFFNMPAFAPYHLDQEETAQSFSERGILLPLFASMTEDEKSLIWQVLASVAIPDQCQFETISSPKNNFTLKNL